MRPSRFTALVLACAAQCGCAKACGTAANDDSRQPPAPSASLATTGAHCPRFAQPRLVGRVEASSIVEASGLVASRKNDDVLWLHNDSGHSEALYAMSTTGKPLATYSVGGASCVDWEDLAIGPGPDGKWFLYVGDTGTNRAARTPIIVYRVEEPQVSATQSPVESTLEHVESFELSYPDDESPDAETLMIDPLTADLYLVTKTTSGRSGVYRAPAPLIAGRRRTLERIATLHTMLDAGRGSERITAGDISPDGRLVLIKTYTHAYLWQREAGATIAQTLATTPCDVPLATEPQGEAIGFAADGMGYFTVSEGSLQPVYFFGRED